MSACSGSGDKAGCPGCRDCDGARLAGSLQSEFPRSTGPVDSSGRYVGDVPDATYAQPGARTAANL